MTNPKYASEPRRADVGLRERAGRCELQVEAPQDGRGDIRLRARCEAETASDQLHLHVQRLRHRDARRRRKNDADTVESLAQQLGPAEEVAAEHEVLARERTQLTDASLEALRASELTRVEARSRSVVPSSCKHHRFGVLDEEIDALVGIGGELGRLRIELGGACERK